MSIKVLVLLALIGACMGADTTTTTMAATTTAAEMNETTTTTKAAETTTTTKAADTTTTTKAAETTTTTAMETTTMPGDMNKFMVTDTNGTVCLVMEAMVLNISVTCEDLHKEMYMVEAKGSTTTGMCKDMDNEIMIKDDSKMYELEMSFAMQDTYYELMNVSVSITDAANKCTVMAMAMNVKDLRAPQSNVYRCNAQRNIMVNDNATLILSGVKLQAFRQGNSTDLTDQQYICMEDSTVSNVVPIAVGCALAGLIIIVLIAYVIGRVRRRPYEPV